MTSTTTTTPGAAVAAPDGGMDLRAIGFAGQRRDDALAAADRELELIVGELLKAGEDEANITLAARLANVSRTTLYRRLAKAKAKALAAAGPTA
jgi:DNA invertase Pin-like site-specific DNA recombinase